MIADNLPSDNLYIQFVEKLKLRALSDLGYSTTIRSACHLCDYHNNKSTCPLSVKKEEEEAGSCGLSCTKQAPYGELMEGPKVEYIDNAVHPSYDFRAYRDLVLDFLSILWQNYLKMDPFNSAKK